MKETTYRCNFCRERIENDEKGYGIAWNAGEETVRVTLLSQSENHLCHTCADAIREMSIPPRF
jgi:hypothetical protein